MFSVIFGTQTPRPGLRRMGVDRRSCRGEARSAVPLPPFPSQTRGRTVAGEQEAQVKIQPSRWAHRERLPTHQAGGPHAQNIPALRQGLRVVGYVLPKCYSHNMSHLGAATTFSYFLQCLWFAFLLSH